MRHMVGMAARRARWGALLAAGLLLATACSGETAETTVAPPPTSTTTIPATTSTTTTSTSTTTTTTMPATTTTVDPLARPDVLVSNVNRDSIDDFDTSGDDLYRITLEILDLFNYLEGNPTNDAEEMVSLMFERDYPFWNPIMVNFLELTENPGWRYVDPGFQPLGIEVLSVDGDTALVAVADVRGEQVIADDAGNVVRRIPGWDAELTEVTLHRGTDGLWRYRASTSSSTLSADDLERLVPVEWKGRNQ